jgi:hypothetical protein
VNLRRVVALVPPASSSSMAGCFSAPALSQLRLGSSMWPVAGVEWDVWQQGGAVAAVTTCWGGHGHWGWMLVGEASKRQACDRDIGGASLLRLVAVATSAWFVSRRSC